MIVVALWFASAWYLMDRFPDTAKLSESALQAAAVRGQFGDMFGGVNALFTALILSGAIYTVWLQHKQLDAMKQQQDDFKHENARTARLQAHAALVDAKSSLLNMRYQMAKDIQPHLQAVEPNSAISGQLFMIVKANYENAGNTMIELETLAKELTAVLSDIPTSDQNAT
jgi:hypothetical protein